MIPAYAVITNQHIGQSGIAVIIVPSSGSIGLVIRDGDISKYGIITQIAPSTCNAIRIFRNENMGNTHVAGIDDTSADSGDNFLFLKYRDPVIEGTICIPTRNNKAVQQGSAHITDSDQHMKSVVVVIGKIPFIIFQEIAGKDGFIEFPVSVCPSRIFATRETTIKLYI